MATTRSATSSSPVIFLLVGLLAAAFAFTAAGASRVATITVVNQCPFTVWPASIPIGCGTQLNPGETWAVKMPAGTAGGRIWARAGCVFTGDRGRCDTGDCAGSFCCVQPAAPPATLAEFTLGAGAGAADFYDISVVDGFNLPMDFSCSTAGDVPVLRCRDPGCADASHPGEAKVHTCSGNADYQVVFCPP